MNLNLIRALICVFDAIISPSAAPSRVLFITFDGTSMAVQVNSFQARSVSTDPTLAAPALCSRASTVALSGANIHPLSSSGDLTLNTAVLTELWLLNESQ